jgi:hypothetical protein
MEMLADSTMQETDSSHGRSEDEWSQIDDLVAERDALRVRLENAIDVRDNLAQWTEKAEQEIISLKTKLVQARSQLPTEESLRRLSEAAKDLPEPVQQLIRDADQSLRRLRVLFSD